MTTYYGFDSHVMLPSVLDHELQVTQMPAKAFLATGKPRLDSTYTATLEKDSELVFRSFDRFTGHTTAC